MAAEEVEIVADFPASETENKMEESEDSSTSDSDDDMECDSKNTAQIQQLEASILESPFMYDPYVELIKLLRQDGELEKLRNTREKMSAMFPLTENIWLEWLEDEQKLASTDSDRERLTKLFERAIKDYLSMRVWLEYIQYSIGGMGQLGGIKAVRSVCERAITAVGLHVTEGASVWEAYREFEMAVLVGLQPVPGSVASEDQQQSLTQQTDRLANLFRRQLAVPLQGMQNTLDEYKDWSEEEENFEQLMLTYKKTTDMLKSLMTYENALSKATKPKLSQYQSYIAYEVKQGQPARVQCLYERAIKDNCLLPELWAQYTKYLDTTLGVADVITSVHERGIRNCPWSVELWLGYARALERLRQPHNTIKELFDRTLNTGLTEGSEYTQVWTAYCDYLRRRISWKDEHKVELEELRSTFEKANTYLMDNFGNGADPECSILRYWAFVEAKFNSDMARSREIWQQVMQQGHHGNRADMWMEFFNLERSYGENKHCCKILQRAVNSVSDQPEVVCNACIEYARQEGTLQQYDEAVSKCESQLKRIMERRSKAAENEALVDRKRPKGGGKGHGKGTTLPGKKAQGKAQTKSQHFVSEKKEKTSEVTVKATPRVTHDQDGFVKPLAAPPGYKHPAQGVKSSPPQGFKSPSTCIQPPPGYKPKRDLVQASTEEEEGPAAKKLKVSEDLPEAQSTSQHGDDKDDRTVFVSNIDFKVTEQTLHELFSKVGKISEVRLVKNFKGRSKGFAYVEFVDELTVAEALSMDRQPLDGRPMYVSKCDSKPTGNDPKFKYSVAMEKNKLFVKGLPFTITQEALQTIFEKYGAIKEIRLVTYRSGANKGLAFVEYEEERSASTAVLQADGLQIGEHTISVAISNPPQRKPAQTDGGFTPTLGSGKTETTSRGKARTQLSMMPRSVQKPNQPAAPSVSNGNKEKTKMSNADFRSMLLKK